MRRGFILRGNKLSSHRYPQPGRPRRRRNIFLCLAAIILALVVIWKVADNGPSVAGPTPEELVRVAPLPSEAAYPAGPLTPETVFDAFVIEKSKRRLYAYHKNKLVRVYAVALGENPVGPKEFEGDKKTPEGRYKITEKKLQSQYYRSLRISYPNAADKKHAASLGKSPGGDIMIHGLADSFAFLGSAHRVTDWTLGCIAVTNEEMDELFQYTVLGAAIEIKP